jgi:hypothetical protein
MKPFQTERELTHVILRSPEFQTAFGFKDWTKWQRQEVEGIFGIPDLVVSYAKEDFLGRKLIRSFAFEIKRANWARALVQAFRYASFAHYSYVIMDAYYVHRALQHIEQFERSKYRIDQRWRHGGVSLAPQPDLWSTLFGVVASQAGTLDNPRLVS